jgi:hypothetical protein
LSYAEKVFSLSTLLEGVRDERVRPRIPTRVVCRSLLVMLLSRLGSLNALEQTAASAFWRRWLRASMPSADTLGRVAAGMDLRSLGQAQQVLYTQLKRNKALPPTVQGLMALALDGHESHATFRRRCPGCLQRTVHTQNGPRTQYYHRHVTALLLAGEYPIFLDAEPLRAGEDEVAAALRLLERLLEHYPRAFDVVLGDALYTDVRLYKFLLSRGKDVMTVLKGNHPDLLADARGLMQIHQPQVSTHGTTTRQLWDFEGLSTWPQLQKPIRVVCSVETTRQRRQKDHQWETSVSQWLWATTCSRHRLATAGAASLGHRRWDIENEGFNETVNRWHADHLYKHHPTAIQVFWLLTMLAFNLFYTFVHRNLKPEYRRRHSALHVARSIAAELYHALPENRAPPC